MLLELWQPPAEKLNTYFILGEIVYNVNSISEAHPNIDTDMLRALADGIRDDRVETEDALRALCQIFRDTYSFDYSLNQLEPCTSAKISAFVDGTAAATIAAESFDARSSSHGHLKYNLSDHLHATSAHRLVEKAKARLGNHPIIYEDLHRSKVMEVYSDVPFSNWALNVKTRPSLTFVPTTVLGLQNLVRTYKDKRIRCSGYRHSRAPVFADDGDILVSMLPLRQVTSLPDPSTLFPDLRTGTSNELRTIQVFPSSKDMASRHVRVGAAVTAEEFRHWAVTDGWTLPVDVLMGEITIGGLNGSICRGSGYSHKTVNDQVRAIEYIDVNGNIQTVTSSEELRAAAGCFGLLGIITHITYEVSRMRYAIMQPRKVPTMLAVPPLDVSNVPEALRVVVTEPQLQDAVAEFEKRAGQDYYAEWVWFPYQNDCFVNTWSCTTDEDGVTEYTSPAETFLQWLSGWLGGIISSTDFFADIPARWQAQLLATTAMAVMPPTTADPADLTIKAALPNAQHFRRDYQYMHVRDMDLEIPIPALSTDPSKPDWSFVRRAWWEVVNLVYSNAASPMRLTLEMRIMADSNIIMAPQTGNTHGTVVIEISTIPDVVSDDEWGPFCQHVLDNLMALAPDANIRPHWGKEWFGLRMNDMPAPQYLKSHSYKLKIVEFKEIMQRIGHRQGWELKDLQQRFSNALWDEIIFDL